MDFKAKRKLEIKRKLPLASELAQNYDKVEDEIGKTIFGIRFYEGLTVKPRKGHIGGLLAGPGVGKSTTSGVMVRDFLLDDRNKGYVAVISLELTKHETLEPIMKSVGNEYPEKLEKLIIIDCYDDEGKDKDMTVQDIKMELLNIQRELGESIDFVIVDHFHETFNNGSTDFNPVAKAYKGLAMELDAFVLLPSQTTKDKGCGDIPVPKNGCYGCSKYENLCSHILTIFQPLLRVQNECDLKALGWQLSKIRWKRGDKDKTKEGINYVYKYVPDEENFEELTPNEKFTFQMYYEKVLELRDNEEKKKSYTFDLSTIIKGKDGKEVKLTKIIGGKEEDS
jgi:hypothetical protein